MRWMLPLLLLAAGWARAADGDAPAAAQTKTLSVLTVGNSFAENACRYLPDIARSAGYTIKIGKANLGGCSLKRHWELVEDAERNPDDPNPDPKMRYGKKWTLAQLLAAYPWDFVTIQQYSYISHDPASYRPFAGKLVEHIRRHAPQSAILVHHTWAYRVDDPSFGGGDAPAKPGQRPRTQAEMHQRVHEAYLGVARELGLGIIPSGSAFFAVDTDPTWGFRPDPAAQREAVATGKAPEQRHSLHTGLRVAPGKAPDGTATYKASMDGHHANKAGSYLAGLCYFERMTGVDSTGIAFRPTEIDADFAAVLRQAAHEAVLASIRETAP